MGTFLVYIFLVGLSVVLIITYILYDMHKQYKKYEQENFMGFGKMNKYDAYNKCIKIVNSCETYQQWLNAMKISHLHYQLYNDGFLQSAISMEHSLSEPCE